MTAFWESEGDFQLRADGGLENERGLTLREREFRCTCSICAGGNVRRPLGLEDKPNTRHRRIFLSTINGDGYLRLCGNAAAHSNRNPEVCHVYRHRF